MTYDEAMAATVTREEARREIEDMHGCDWADFADIYGEREVYPGGTVLAWLGY